MSIGSLLKSAGTTTAIHALFGANDEIYGVAKNLWYKKPNKAMAWSMLASGIALATTFNDKIAMAAAFIDPFVTRACAAHKRKLDQAVSPTAQRNKMIGAMIAGTSAIAAGKLLLDAVKGSKKPDQQKTEETPQTQSNTISS